MAKLKAAIFVEAGRIALEDTPIPDIGLLDALIRITTTTICGTDVHILKGEYPVKKGLTVGREPAGMIEKPRLAVAGFGKFWRLALGLGPLVIQGPALAQNPCGYAFSITGQQLFNDHCAACHGPDGRGDGPLAAMQKKPPANLTGIKKRNGGQYPADRIVEIIRYGGGIPGHEKDQMMPLWAKVFSSECGAAYSRRSVVELNRYLETLQK